MSEKEKKKIQFSVDRLTLVCDIIYDDLFNQLINYINSMEIFKEYKNVSTFFDRSFDIPGLGMLQIDRKLMKMRIDFNPNNVTSDGINQCNILLAYVQDVHVTRLDLAIDLFDYNIKDYTIIDIGNRKTAYFYDRVGKLETIYSGSMKSDKYIRIYNKAVEQKIKNKDWWRFEVQLRDKFIEKYTNEIVNFFSDILVFKYNSVDDYTIEENAMVEFLLHDISRLNKLGKNQKTKYKRIIKSLKISSLDFFDDIITLTNNSVIAFLDDICTSKRYPDGSAIKITSTNKSML